MALVTRDFAMEVAPLGNITAAMPMPVAVLSLNPPQVEPENTLAIQAQPRRVYISDGGMDVIV